MTAPLLSDWQFVCHVDDIPPLGARVVRRARGPAIALFRTGNDHVFALLDRCPHKGGPLSQGIVHGESVTCPLHGFTIALGDGNALAPDRGCAPALQVWRDGTAVYLRHDELASIGLADNANADGTLPATA